MTRRNPETCRQNQGQFDLLARAARSFALLVRIRTEDVRC